MSISIDPKVFKIALEHQRQGLNVIAVLTKLDTRFNPPIVREANYWVPELESLQGDLEDFRILEEKRLFSIWKDDMFVYRILITKDREIVKSYMSFWAGLSREFMEEDTYRRK